MELSPPRAWAEIDLSALRHNFLLAREKSGGQGVMAVVKANAYGHGVKNVVQALEDLKPTFYGVANVAEARELKAILPSARIYLLGAANQLEYREIVQEGYIACASSMEELTHFAALAKTEQKKIFLHIAVDTGMGRGGFLPQSVEFQEALSFSHPNIEIEGIGSHCPVSDEDEAFTRKQFKEFESLLSENFKYRHLANSAGLLHYKSESLNLVRPGLMLYGCSPQPEYQNLLKPAMKLCSRVSLIRNVPKGHGISYGRTYITTRDTKIAIVGIGYADGLLRSISKGNPHIYINGQRAPILGRITMDQIIVDITVIADCKTGDEVEIFGSNILVSEVAHQAGTIPWEIFTGIAPRVQRVLV